MQRELISLTSKENEDILTLSQSPVMRAVFTCPIVI